MNMDLLPDVEIRRNVVFREDRHLSSALLSGELDYIMAHKDNPRTLKDEHRLLLADLGTHTLIHPRYA